MGFGERIAVLWDNPHNRARENQPRVQATSIDMARRTRRDRDQRKDEYAGYFDEDQGPLAGRDRRRRPREPNQGIQLPAWSTHLVILAAAAAALLGLIWLTAGTPMLEKTLQALVAPTGLLWMGLFLVTYFCLLYRAGFPALVSFGCWVLLTICGSSLVSNLLTHSLQREYLDFDLQQLQPLDVVAVLGGGMMTAPNGQPQIADAGDRAWQALRLFQSGKTAQILCAGTSGLPLARGELSQADALESFLIAGGVPADKILKIGGRNTLQEIRALDQWISERGGGDLRLGIMTSAWHLPRAMRLAASVGIQAQPIPADFSETRVRQDPHLLIPGSHQLHQVTQALKEYLAGWLGR